MKLWAKVRLNGEENASELVCAFFKEFNPESSIVIKGKEAKVEIIFDNNPPMEIIKAVKQCDIIEFYFGKALGEYSEDETEQVSVKEERIPEEIEQVVAETEISEKKKEVIAEEKTTKQTEHPKKKRGRQATKKVETTKVAKTEAVNIPQLEEIAKDAIYFEHFVELVAEWLGMGKKQQFFEKLVMVASEVGKVSWKELENALKNKGINYTQYYRIYIGQRVAENFKEYSITFLPFLDAMRQYKNYSFGPKKTEEVPTEQTEEATSKNRFKMECMPEIPCFEEILGSVDKTQPIEDRVRYVLNGMGLEKKNAQEQQQIFEIANTAVIVGKIDFDIIFSKANIPMESSMEARMTFSKFINDFVSEYDSDKKVKLLDFLKQLQEIVMYESEIESSSPSIN